MSSNSELFNEALTLYKWALNTLDDGRVPAGVNLKDDTYRELSTLTFDNLKKDIPWGVWDELENE